MMWSMITNPLCFLPTVDQQINVLATDLQMRAVPTLMPRDTDTTKTVSIGTDGLASAMRQINDCAARLRLAQRGGALNVRDAAVIAAYADRIGESLAAVHAGLSAVDEARFNAQDVAHAMEKAS